MTDLRQGDCLELMKDIPDKSIDMILCDLPYGTTACKWDVVIPFEPLWEQYKRIIKDRGAIVLFGSEPFSSYLRMSNIKQYKYDWVWDKVKPSTPGIVHYQPNRVFENIIIFNTGVYYPQMVKKDSPRTAYGATVTKNNEHGFGFKPCPAYKITHSYPTNILRFSNALQKGKMHPTQKPVALLEYLIKTYTLEGETVLDNCMGSGSTGVACVNTNRKFIGIELDETYFNIAKDRINKARYENDVYTE
jgi:site-specific DNA-methyltransferase (adenine-specific)